MTAKAWDKKVIDKYQKEISKTSEPWTKKQKEDIEECKKLVEEALVKINKSLFDGHGELIEFKNPPKDDPEFLFTYVTFSNISDSIIGMANQINYLSSSVFLIAFMNSLMQMGIKEKKFDESDIDIILKINASAKLLVSTFKDLTIFKNFLMALRKVYNIEHTKPLVEELESIQNQLIQGFEEFNEDAELINSTVGNQIKLGYIRLNDTSYIQEFDRMLEKVKDLRFLAQSYEDIANEFYPKFNVVFIDPQLK